MCCGGWEGVGGLGLGLGLGLGEGGLGLIGGWIGVNRTDGCLGGGVCGNGWVMSGKRICTDTRDMDADDAVVWWLDNLL